MTLTATFTRHCCIIAEFKCKETKNKFTSVIFMPLHSIFYTNAILLNCVTVKAIIIDHVNIGNINLREVGEACNSKQNKREQLSSFRNKRVRPLFHWYVISGQRP
jgi:hypothetical protein